MCIKCVKSDVVWDTRHSTTLHIIDPSHFRFSKVKPDLKVKTSGSHFLFSERVNLKERISVCRFRSSVRINLEEGICVLISDSIVVNIDLVVWHLVYQWHPVSTSGSTGIKWPDSVVFSHLKGVFTLDENTHAHVNCLDHSDVLRTLDLLCRRLWDNYWVIGLNTVFFFRMRISKNSRVCWTTNVILIILPNSTFVF